MTSAPHDNSLSLLSITDAGEEHLREILNVHKEAFRGFFLTRLGDRFLLRYYRTVLYHPGSCLLVAQRDREVIGFVAGFCRRGEFYRALNAQRFALLRDLLGHILFHPSLIPRLVLDYRLSTLRASAGADDACELASLGVRTRSMGGGVGRALVQRFVTTAFQRGAACVTLTTDACNNERTNAFYQRTGFRLRRTLMVGTRALNEYEILKTGAEESG